MKRIRYGNLIIQGSGTSVGVLLLLVVSWWRCAHINLRKNWIREGLSKTEVGCEWDIHIGKFLLYYKMAFQSFTYVGAKAKFAWEIAISFHNGLFPISCNEWWQVLSWNKHWHTTILSSINKDCILYCILGTQVHASFSLFEGTNELQPLLHQAAR